MYKKLFIPGPTDVTPEVLEKMATPMIGHRTKEATALQQSASEKLQKLMYTENTILLSTSSGTGLMEGSIRSCTLKKAAVLATVVLLIVCSFSAFVALVDNSTAANLQGMLHLGFEITRMSIWILVVLGGLALLYVQLLLVYGAGKAAYHK